MFLPRSRKLHWTFHARAKMAFYKLSEQRVRRVMNSPRRIEEGIAPKTVAMMQPVSLKTMALSETAPSGAKWSRGASTQLGSLKNGREETWNQEIWVMIQDERNRRKIISAWRYPGKTKPRDEVLKDKIKAAYNEYMVSAGK